MQKIFQWLLGKAIFLLAGAIVLVLFGWPFFAMVFGIGSMAINEPKNLLYLALYILAIVAGVAIIFGLGAYLFNHPKIGPIAQFIFWALVVLLLVRYCVTHSGSSSDCTPSRYITCDY